MRPTPVYGARAEKPVQNADFAMKQTNICRLSGDISRMVQLPATAAIEYVAARTRTITRTRTKTKIGTITKTVRGPYARSPQVQYVYAPSGLSVPSNVA